MPKRKDLKGQVFGRLTVVGFSSIEKGRAVWECSCSCGNQKKVNTGSLISGHTKSCGCFRDQSNAARGFKHGHAPRNERGGKSDTYSTWSGMLTRCLNPESSSYKDYGAKGVTVHPDWLEFSAFLKDMGERPDGMTLDREDTLKGYEKSNCRWATRLEQGNNKRNTVLLNFKDQSLTQSQFSRLTGINQSVVSKDLKNGLNLDQIFLNRAKETI